MCICKFNMQNLITRRWLIRMKLQYEITVSTNVQRTLLSAMPKAPNVFSADIWLEAVQIRFASCPLPWQKNKMHTLLVDIGSFYCYRHTDLAHTVSRITHCMATYSSYLPTQLTFPTWSNTWQTVIHFALYTTASSQHECRGLDIQLYQWRRHGQATEADRKALWKQQYIR